MPDRDAAIDRLYQVPLEEFTPARNALAKERKDAELKKLEKPNVAAWAVNQLYWNHRAQYDEVVKAGERLRAEHRKLLGGKPTDIRDPERVHREAIRSASERIRELLAQSGHSATDQTMHAVQQTLEALPSSEPPGRLTRPLKPLGFEALAGISLAASPRPQLRVVPPPKAKVESQMPARDLRRERELAQQREQEERARRERQQQAQKELKAAEQAMLRAEDAVKRAEKALGELRAKRDAAVSEYQRARLRAHE